MAQVGQPKLFLGGYQPPNATSGTFSYLWEVFHVGTTTPVGSGVAVISSPNAQNTNITWQSGTGGNSYDVKLTVTQSGVSCGVKRYLIVQENIEVQNTSCPAQPVTLVSSAGSCNSGQQDFQINVVLPSGFNPSDFSNFMIGIDGGSMTSMTIDHPVTLNSGGHTINVSYTYLGNISCNATSLGLNVNCNTPCIPIGFVTIDWD